MANPIAKEMSEDYGVTPQRAACLLDTFSCIAQGVIPYGAQILVAVTAASEMGCVISAFDLISKLYYPALLLVCSLIAIFMPVKKRAAAPKD
jgi:Na+/H+ antiporter NhaC